MLLHGLTAHPTAAIALCEALLPPKLIKKLEGQPLIQVAPTTTVDFVLTFGDLSADQCQWSNVLLEHKRGAQPNPQSFAPYATLEGRSGQQYRDNGGLRTGSGVQGIWQIDAAWLYNADLPENVRDARLAGGVFLDRAGRTATETFRTTWEAAQVTQNPLVAPTVRTCQTAHLWLPRSYRDLAAGMRRAYEDVSSDVDVVRACLRPLLVAL